jgi:hypothetical protein
MTSAQKQDCFTSFSGRYIGFTGNYFKELVLPWPLHASA